MKLGNMGKYDLFDTKFYNDKLPENAMFSWKIFACQGSFARVYLKETLETQFTEHGFNLKIEEPNIIVFQHPEYDFPVEVEFNGDVTTTSGGRHYRMCIHSESHTLTIEDESIQRELYSLVMSILPYTWGKESYRIEDGKDIPVKTRRFRLKQKRK